MLIVRAIANDKTEATESMAPTLNSSWPPSRGVTKSDVSAVKSMVAVVHPSAVTVHRRHDMRQVDLRQT